MRMRKSEMRMWLSVKKMLAFEYEFSLMVDSVLDSVCLQQLYIQSMHYTCLKLYIAHYIMRTFRYDTSTKSSK